MSLVEYAQNGILSLRAENTSLLEAYRRGMHYRTNRTDETAERIAFYEQKNAELDEIIAQFPIPH